MSSFEDFMATLTPDILTGIIDDANLKAQQMRGKSGNSLTSFGNQIGAVSYTISLELLACYHKWLEQQL